jgi:hypothetical protein
VTVTVHDFLGPRLVPVQPSRVMANPAGGATVILSAALADPPELASVNTCGADVTPGASVPKLTGPGGDQASIGAEPALATPAPVPSITTTAPAATTARQTRLRIAEAPPLPGQYCRRE